jgi:ubiquinone/menaquinone biosynthesis C-methylase UbiE
MWHAFAGQLANPRGISGWAVGKLMKRANRQPTRLAIDALDIQAGDQVLDLGCGAGQAMALMVPLAGHGLVYGIDQSKVMVAEAVRSNPTGDVSVHHATFGQLPFEGAFFDKILASNVMYFWPDTNLVLREIRRVLKPGGRLVIYVTDAETMQGWKIAGAGTHRLFSAVQVAEALNDGGFARNEIMVKSVPIKGGIKGVIAVARAKS